MATYYVDSDIGSDSYTYIQAQNPSTPKQTVDGIMACDPGAGDIVKFRGAFTETIFPTSNGDVLYAFQQIEILSGSTITFGITVSGLNPATDYVTIYHSKMGNSGAFPVVSFSGATVTVDTSDLPLGALIPETSGIYGAIVRPIHFTAWEKGNMPVFTTLYQCYKAINNSAIMVSYLKSAGGDTVNPGFTVWPAFEVDGSDNGNSDYQIFDHLEIINAASAISTENTNFHSNYDIIQHCNIHDLGCVNGSDYSELLYWGRWGTPNYHHDYCQMVYNTIGPSLARCTPTCGVDLKQSAHFTTIFGNEFKGLNTAGWGEACIHCEGQDVDILNNYFHDIHPESTMSCGVYISDAETSDPLSGSTRVTVANNLFYDVAGCALQVVDSCDIKILNNTIYHVPRDSNNNLSDADEWWAGILLFNWNGDLADIMIRNNIVQDCNIGIGRYVGSNDTFNIDIDSDYNICYDCTYPFRGSITQNIHDQIIDPKFENAHAGNFRIRSDSPAIDMGVALIDVPIDYARLSRPRESAYDIGAYEYEEEEDRGNESGGESEGLELDHRAISKGDSMGGFLVP